MQEKTKLLIEACRLHRSMSAGHRKLLAQHFRNTRKLGKKVGVQWSPKLGRLIVWFF